MKRGRIIIITDSSGIGKTTTAPIVAKEAYVSKFVYIHTDDFYHYIQKGSIE